MYQMVHLVHLAPLVDARWEAASPKTSHDAVYLQ